MERRKLALITSAASLIVVPIFLMVAGQCFEAGEAGFWDWECEPWMFLPLHVVPLFGAVTLVTVGAGTKKERLLLVLGAIIAVLLIFQIWLGLAAGSINIGG